MSITSLLLIILGAVYGSLTILAGSLQLKQRKISLLSSLLMIVCGAALIAFTTFLSSMASSLFAIIASLTVLHMAAISNGLHMFGKLNIKHHIARLMISLTLVFLCFIK